MVSVTLLGLMAMFRVPDDSFENTTAPSYLWGGNVGISSRELPQVHALQTGISPGGLIETIDGPVAAKSIEQGQLVLTQAHGYRPILWTGRIHRHYFGDARSLPMRIAPGTLGKSSQSTGTLLAPDQHIHLRHALNEDLFGHENVLVRAKDLSHLRGVSPASGRYAVDWVQLLFDQVELVKSDGLWVESMLADQTVLGTAPADLLADVQNAVPGLRYEHRRASYAHPFPVLNAQEVSMLGLDG